MTRFDRVLPLLLILALGGTGCTAVGYTVGSEMSDAGDKGWGHPVDMAEADFIAHGTPVQAGLSDSGYVRGVWLGVVGLDSPGVATPRRAALLGTGNRIQLDALFSSGQVLANPTREQVPDTLRLALDGITELRLPGSPPTDAAKVGTAVGLAVDSTLVVIVCLAAVASLIFFVAK